VERRIVKAAFCWAILLGSLTLGGCVFDYNLSCESSDDCADGWYCGPTKECLEAANPCVIYVDGRVASSGDGLSWEGALKTVQEGMATVEEALHAAKSCEVWVAEGQYHVYRSSRLDAIRLVSKVGLYGGFSGRETSRDDRDYRTHMTVLDGRSASGKEQVYHVLKGMDSAVIDGFVITGGLADAADPHNVGGGIYNDRQSPTVTNCIITSNRAEIGGGMYNIDSSPIITNSSFSKNSASTKGGGMYNGEGSSPRITNCVFDSNSAVEGGAVYHVNKSSPPFKNCAFTANTAERGGAVFSTENSSPLFRNATFYGNSAGSGAGIYSAGGSPSVANSILWGNVPDGIADVTSTMNVLYSDVQGWSIGLANISQDPLFANPGDRDVHLKAGSPCIDRANGDLALSTDLDGSYRYDDPSTPNTGSGNPTYADMGAYEYRP